jgi:hypothetical protein
MDFTEFEDPLRPGAGLVDDADSFAREAAEVIVDSRFATRLANAGASVGRGGGDGKLLTRRSLAAPFVGVSAFDSSEREVRDRVLRELGETPFASDCGVGGAAAMVEEGEVGLRSTPRCL